MPERKRKRKRRFKTIINLMDASCIVPKPVLDVVNAFRSETELTPATVDAASAALRSRNWVEKIDPDLADDENSFDENGLNYVCVPDSVLERCQKLEAWDDGHEEAGRALSNNEHWDITYACLIYLWATENGVKTSVGWRQKRIRPKPPMTPDSESCGFFMNYFLQDPSEDEAQ